MCARLVHALLGLAREHLHAGRVAELGLHLLADREHRVALRAAAELVGLGQDRVRGQAAADRVAEHLLVVVLERVADVHHHDQALERLAGAEILVEERLPVRLQVLGHLGEAIAGQVDQVLFGGRRDVEEHQLLGAAGGLGDPRQRVLLADRIERGRLAGVGAAGKGDLEAAVGRELVGDCAPPEGTWRGRAIGHGTRIARRDGPGCDAAAPGDGPRKPPGAAGTCGPSALTRTHRRDDNSAVPAAAVAARPLVRHICCSEPS